MSTNRLFSRKKAQKAQKLEALNGVLENVFPNFELPAAKVNEQAMLDSTGTEITEQLCDVFVIEGLDGFDFYRQQLGNKMVCPKIAEHGPVIAMNGKSRSRTTSHSLKISRVVIVRFPFLSLLSLFAAKVYD